MSRALLHYKFLVGFLSLLIVSCSTKESHDSQSEELSVEAEEAKGAEESFDLHDFKKLVESYEDPARGEWQNPNFVLKSLGDIKNKTIADIGAGTGYFTFRLAAKGANVIAIDIDEHFLDYIENRKGELKSQLSDLIELRLSLENDPLLKREEADIALLVNTYHFIEDRGSYLEKVKSGLKVNGKIVIVDYKLDETISGPDDEFKVEADKVIEELVNAGFQNISVNSKDLKYQYLISADK